MFWTSHPVDKISGIVTAPGDKSCSHRALIFSGLADGTSKISGLLEGEDVLNTGRAMSALGATVDRTGTNQWTVKGVGTAGLVSP
ncbi:MAG: 3-phosphoshikimate 1-carboxyvinyltransferase, partial [Henriciella sp.]